MVNVCTHATVSKSENSLKFLERCFNVNPEIPSHLVRRGYILKTVLLLAVVRTRKYFFHPKKRKERQRKPAQKGISDPGASTPGNLGWGHQSVNWPCVREGACADCLFHLCHHFYLVEHVSVESEPASGFSGL